MPTAIIIIIVVLIGVAIGAILGVKSAVKKRPHQPSAQKPDNLTSFSQKFDANITTLGWNVSSAELSVQPGPVFEVSINNTAVDQFNCTRNGHKLTITQLDPLQHPVESGQSARVVITVPRPVRIEATMLNGTLNITSVTLKSIDLNHLNGTTNIRDVEINDGIITKKNGATKLTNVLVPGLRVVVESGQLLLNGASFAADQLPYDDGQETQLDVQSTNGPVTITTQQ
ncbi:DUF4097 family beta strand repeat-containing protein [Lacticaseibacillus sharpeae]|uniref:DUF4097 domain-containing protein n=1 Tax=Lacticaseibacillus sharpeae JCM 1186 = DSM 20505 TaxID=1291052 RepID=A0A0R1ZWH0_9LACO|nr:DUF4097 family beta strand repeat-containing protein [Lacticaseibacillus sharpeae]KRM55411.1 hypothetical protein FC18_GL001306 [Lacticaseibacillus sharpeae JCM 1186 = DSM 20505]